MKIVHVEGNDWEAVYVDGDCVAQDHLLSGRDVLRALGVEVEFREADGDWLDEERHFPDNIKDVKFADEAPEPPKPPKKKGKKKSG